MKKTITLFTAILILIFIAFFSYSLIYNDDLQVHFLDIGMGDSICIRTPYEQNIIIDGGPSNAVLSKLGKCIPFYDQKIDLMILTHPDADHLTGLVPIIQRYKVERILEPEIKNNTELFLEWKKIIKQKQILLIYAKAGQNFNLGSDLNIKILNPNEKLSTSANLNDFSIVAKMTFQGKTFLFTGDAGVKIETWLIDFDIKSDVLKIGHHGSATSSSLNFLKKVNPEICIISVGKNNFELPSVRVLKRLTNFCKIYRTDKLGSINIIANKKTLKILP